MILNYAASPLRTACSLRTIPLAQFKRFKNSLPLSDRIQLIQRIRSETSAPLMLVKNSVDSCDGTYANAMLGLRSAMIDKAKRLSEKLKDRETKQGWFAVAKADPDVHAQSRQIAMVDLRCETDFVANNFIFRQLAQRIAFTALQVGKRGGVLTKDILLKEQILPSAPETIRNLIPLDEHLHKALHQYTIQMSIMVAIGILGENIQLNDVYCSSSNRVAAVACTGLAKHRLSDDDMKEEDDFMLDNVTKLCQSALAIEYSDPEVITETEENLKERIDEVTSMTNLLMIERHEDAIEVQEAFDVLSKDYDLKLLGRPEVLKRWSR